MKIALDSVQIYRNSMDISVELHCGDDHTIISFPKDHPVLEQVARIVLTDWIERPSPPPF